jgi:hypothetical protein
MLPTECQRTDQQNGADATKDNPATLSTKKCEVCGMNGRAIPLDSAVDMLQRQAVKKPNGWPSLAHQHCWDSFSNYTSDVTKDGLLQMDKWEVADLLKRETKKLLDRMRRSRDKSLVQDKVSCVFTCECGKFLLEPVTRYGPSPPEDFEQRPEDFGQRSRSFVEETTWRESFWRLVKTLNDKRGKELEDRKRKRGDQSACRCDESGGDGDWGDEDWAAELVWDLKHILVVHSDAGDSQAHIQVEEWDCLDENWFVVDSTWQDHDAQAYRIQNDDSLDRYPKEDRKTPFKVWFHV